MVQHGRGGFADGGMGEAGDLAAGRDAADADCRDFSNGKLLERPCGEAFTGLVTEAMICFSSAAPGGTGM